MKRWNWAEVAVGTAVFLAGCGGASDGADTTPKAAAASFKVFGDSLADSGTFGYKFTVQGKDASGNAKKGEIRAPSEAYARALLRRQGVIPSRIKRKPKPMFGSSIKEKDLVICTRQLATMINAGVPLVQAITLIGAGSAKGLQGLLKSASSGQCRK